MYVCVCVYICVCLYIYIGFPDGSAGKESASNVGNTGFNPWLGRSRGGGNDNPLQYS